jgi:hypothetical protein
MKVNDGGNLSSSGGFADMPMVDKNGKKLSFWQKRVWQEWKRRESGSGLLGISFWFVRKYFTKTTGMTYIENRSKLLGTLMRVTQSYQESPDGMLAKMSITGLTPGLAKVAQRYNIIAAVISQVISDIKVYTDRKLTENAVKSFLK